MPTEVIAPRNLKFKITTKGIRSDLVNASVKNCQKIQVSEIGNKHRPEMNLQARKRKPEDSHDDRRAKRRNMDRVLKIQCGTLLKELMSHRGAHIFAQPVDPVKLNIPDYFSFVSKPMDLGTIKRKLESNEYFTADQFADDVRLTFSNAIAYNPEGHAVHKLAKEMMIIFCRKWRSLVSKLIHPVENNQKDTKPIGFMRVHREEKPARAALKVCSSLRTTIQKAPCLPRARPLFDLNESPDATRDKCPSCASSVCHCRLKNGSAQTSTSDISSERSSENNKSVDSKQEREVKRPLPFCLDSDGPGVVTNEVKSPHRSPPDTIAAVSVEDWTSMNVEVSPSKALRAAMLKSRFADTIFKATHQNDEKLASRNREARERLEREKQQEKARIEREIKAAEAASRMRELNKFKMQNDFQMKRDRDRAAAKIALQQMQRTVVINEGMEIIEDVQTMFRGYLSSKPLERLGLYFKIDYLREVEDEDFEEGEILS
ncbi:hypothetical protein CASFOL_039354 [Castilleja foliolosa]|uniref:Bromo domain-containing protein n=1 Tax=Castilleja foliolosa TaxID=1961234 RepID=A0ABD3BJR2_9LAMI